MAWQTLRYHRVVVAPRPLEKKYGVPESPKVDGVEKFESSVVGSSGEVEPNAKSSPS